MSNILKSIKLMVTSDTKNAEAGFDGLDVSTKDLQDRISYLNAEMRKLETQFGKSGLASKEYAMFQREADIATKQLINSQEKQEQSNTKSVRGLGSLGSASVSALGSISGLGTGISVLSNSLMAGAGLSAGLAGITIAFSLLMESIRDANEETKKFNKSVADLIDVKLPGGGFKIAPENLQSTIDYLDAQIKQKEYFFKQQLQSNPLFGNVPKDDQLLKTYKATKEALEGINKEYQNQKAIIDSLTSAGFLYTKEEEEGSNKRKTNNKEQLEWLKKYEELLNDIYDSTLKIQKENIGKTDDLMKPYKEFFTPGVKDIKKPGLSFDIKDVYADIYKENQLLIDSMISAADVLRSEFKSAWQDIFGEANSLFEKFMMNIIEKMASNAITNFASTFLNFLVPGAGSAFNALAGAPTVINVNMGNETLARAVVKGSYEAKRLRLSN